MSRLVSPHGFGDFQLSKQAALLVAVELHPPQNSGQYGNRLVDEGALVQHDALRGDAGRSVGHFGARRDAGAHQRIQHRPAGAVVARSHGDRGK